MVPTSQSYGMRICTFSLNIGQPNEFAANVSRVRKLLISNILPQQPQHVLYFSLEEVFCGQRGGEGGGVTLFLTIFRF